ncbi:unnamed protein product [Nesidiocoris tenuis]|uniref:Transient receptor ion channel domain-containing protein n=1 Tax=Nesidiocoris tenuis TaxID=355587 RepID=A0A6H5FZN0_9HEMI|nr:unnamed protein product [Nesidiocoris tenuis]
MGPTGSFGQQGAEIMSADIEPHILTPIEKKFLLMAERGNCASVKKLIEDYKDKPEELDINCVDPLNRSALTTAIENENMDLIEILLSNGIKVKDSLLHAIKEQYVEGVEVLLEWEEQIHTEGQPYSWEAVDRSSSNFTPDITPLVLAAQMNNYEIIKILLDRGASLPMPHEIRCACDECLVSREQDSLRHSQSRINAYKALTASSLIALSSRDPLQTAFELSWELRRMARVETEFRAEYNEMRKQVQEFATSLLDHARTSNELEVMLNYDPNAGPLEVWQPGDRQTLERLKLAIKYKQKAFVAHPNVQQLLAAIWYEGLPGFRRKSMAVQLFELAKLGCMFPVYSAIYMLAPKSPTGLFMKKPFVKFIIHSASYSFFLMLNASASQRVETLLLEWFGTDWMRDLVKEWQRRERGSLPGLVESMIIIYVISLIWSETKSLYRDGLLEYISDLWNIVDFITYFFYGIWIFMRATSWYIVQREGSYGVDPYYPREKWDLFDPMLISEGAFAAGMIFSFLKLVHIFSVNPHLGPLQISLGRMIIDIIKFFFIYTLVLFAFGCGLNQLLWYYSVLEKNRCYHTPDGEADFDNQERACQIWRRFSNLFETSQSLFWASFGLVDLMNFELTGIKGFTRFWALLMFGSYSVINIIVLLNMLIAMMSNSYQIISERSDVEWKFARSKLWMSYFEDGDTIPPPFNMLPTVKTLRGVIGCGKALKPSASMQRKSRTFARERHETVMKLLIRRYVTAEQCKRDEFGVTEDDVMEIRQDISTLRFELIDIFSNNGMKTPNVNRREATGKKGRVMERRLAKDFQIGLVEGMINAVVASEPKNVFSKLAKVIGRKTSGKGSKKDWNAMVRQGTVARDPIGTTSEARKKISRQSARRHILEHQNQPLNTMDPEKLVDYNPKLSSVSPATRVAYAKFKINKIKTEFQNKEKGMQSETTSLSGKEETQQSRELQKKESLKKKIPGKNEYVEAGAYSSQDEEQQEQKKDFRSRTPIPEEPDIIIADDVLQIVTEASSTPTASTPSTPTITFDQPTPRPSPELMRRASLSIHDDHLKTPPPKLPRSSSSSSSSPTVTVEIEPEPQSASSPTKIPSPPPTPKHSPRTTSSSTPSPKASPGNWL